jgi:hypothetical protein
VNPPDISTPETENPPEERAASRTAWRLGPISCLVIGLVVISDMAMLGSQQHSDDSLRIGWTFGQLSAAIVWFLVAGVFTWRRLLVVYLVALLTSLMMDTGSPAGASHVAMMFTIYAVYATAAILLHFLFSAIRAARAGTSTTTSKETLPAFGVRHLLIATTLVAIGALLVRFALPELENVQILALCIWGLQSCVLVHITATIIHKSGSPFWQLSQLLTSALVVSFLAGVLVGPMVWWSNAPQVFALALTIVVPRIDGQEPSTTPTI